MQKFTGVQYLKIDIANNFGMDKEVWSDRIQWVISHDKDLEDLAIKAKHPILYKKAVRALRTVQKGEPTNHIMGLDATASGLQILAALAGCRNTARCVNLINTGKREDVYDFITNHMVNNGKLSVTRDVVKKPLMTVFYGSKRQPAEVFRTSESLEVFYDAICTELTGAYELTHVIQDCWRSGKTYHAWTMPDAHRVFIPVTGLEQEDLEVDEANHLRFTYQTNVIKPQPKGLSLAANVVHSLDGWIAREMVNRANKAGFRLAPIHDCFYASPNHMNQVREFYVELLCWIASHDVIETILSEITGIPFRYKKQNPDISNEIRQSEYALS